ncbi:MAG: 50S ribosomal protein L25 [bacterium]|nr:50S ribosomal protein L25 [bacterium]
MAIVDLPVQARTKIGKGGARKLRQEGKVPGILYGSVSEVTPFAVNANVLKNVLAKHPTMIRLIHSELEGTNCIIREIQKHPVTGKILHLDLQAISAGEKVKMFLPIHLEGIASGVKDFGGVMDHILHQIEVEVNPLEAPDFISVDVTKLGLNEKITVGEIEVKEGIKILTELDEVIAIVLPSKVSAEAKHSAEVKPPEVITERKKEKEVQE